MAINRRSFLIGGSIGLALGPTQLLAANASTRLLSCSSNYLGEHFVSLFDTQEQRLVNIHLPERGHGICLDESHRHAAVFARRPGEFVWILDLESWQVVHRINAIEGRHYYGHGLFTPDGQLLLCSENAYESGVGCIGIYDLSADFSRIGEIPSHGVGPHEIKLLNDGQTLVVANGGIRTHPDFPRMNTNVKTMRPNLAYVDIRSGRFLQKQEPPAQWHQLSIRHIDVTDDDRVAVAMQFMGQVTLHPPLIAIQHGYQDMALLSAPGKIQRQMRNYCGSVTFSHDGSRFAVSSPRGGLVTYWTSTGKYLGVHQQEDACGLSAISDSGKDFLVSDGTGRLQQIDESLMLRSSYEIPETRWDNHMLSLA